MTSINSFNPPFQAEFSSSCLFKQIWYLFTTMSQDMLIQLKNKETGEVYFTRKNRKKVERKIELKKYSKKLRKRVVFKESKK